MFIYWIPPQKNNNFVLLITSLRFGIDTSVNDDTSKCIFKNYVQD